MKTEVDSKLNEQLSITLQYPTIYEIDRFNGRVESFLRRHGEMRIFWGGEVSEVTAEDEGVGRQGPVETRVYRGHNKETAIRVNKYGEIWVRKKDDSDTHYEDLVVSIGPRDKVVFEFSPNVISEERHYYRRIEKGLNRRNRNSSR